MNTRIVFDTNVYISALFFGKKVKEIFKRGFKDCDVYVSPELLAELEDVIARKEFFVSEETSRDIEYILSKVKIIKPTVKITKCRDPKDNFVLEIAQTCQADFIVTGDKDLLVMQVWHDTFITTPFVFSLILDEKEKEQKNS
jgi:putative PIN family toxin of toxin-antitoxin system